MVPASNICKYLQVSILLLLLLLLHIIIIIIIITTTKRELRTERVETVNPIRDDS